MDWTRNGQESFARLGQTALCSISTQARAKSHVLDAFRGILIMELHVTEELAMKTNTDLRRFIAFYEELVEKRGWRLWSLHINPGGFADRSVHPDLANLGLKQGVCCYEVALVHPDRLLAK